MNNKDFNNAWLDEETVETVSLQPNDVIDAVIVSCNVYKDSLIINLSTLDGTPISNIASFACGTPRGLQMAKEFFGKLLGPTVLRQAIKDCVGAQIKVKAVANDQYINLRLYTTDADVPTDVEPVL